MLALRLNGESRILGSEEQQEINSPFFLGSVISICTDHSISSVILYNEQSHLR